MKKAGIVFLGIGLVIAAYLILSPEHEIRNTVPAGDAVICFGDSLTAGTGSSPGMDYPSQLSGLLGIGVINAGHPGDTTGDALVRLDRDVLSQSPRIVLVTLGGNDLKNCIPREQAFANLKEIIGRIQDKGALVVVGGIDIPLFGRGFNDGYERVCRETGAVLIPDIYDGILGRDDLMSDPIHPNDKGYQIMAERFYTAMRPYL
jgi:lysophospholipase L1-like esterase